MNAKVSHGFGLNRLIKLIPTICQYPNVWVSSQVPLPLEVHLTCLMAVLNPLLTEFAFHHWLETCLPVPFWPIPKNAKMFFDFPFPHQSRSSPSVIFSQSKPSIFFTSRWNHHVSYFLRLLWCLHRKPLHAIHLWNSSVTHSTYGGR